MATSWRPAGTPFIARTAAAPLIVLRAYLPVCPCCCFPLLVTVLQMPSAARWQATGGGECSAAPCSCPLLARYAIITRQLSQQISVPCQIAVPAGSWAHIVYRGGVPACPSRDGGVPAVPHVRAVPLVSALFSAPFWTLFLCHGRQTDPFWWRECPSLGPRQCRPAVIFAVAACAGH